MTAHALDDPQALFYSGAQVFRALHFIGLEQVIRAYTGFKQSMAELHLILHGIIDSGQQHRLVVDGNAVF